MFGTRSAGLFEPLAEHLARTMAPYLEVVRTDPQAGHQHLGRKLFEIPDPDDFGVLGLHRRQNLEETGTQLAFVLEFHRPVFGLSVEDVFPFGGGPAVGISDGILEHAVKPGEQSIAVFQVRRIPEGFYHAFLNDVLGLLGCRHAPPDVCDELLARFEKYRKERVCGSGVNIHLCRKFSCRISCAAAYFR